MTTYKAVLTETSKNINSAIYTSYIIPKNPYGMLWGKGLINEKNKTIEFVQAMGSCKDFVVDTYYRTHSNGFVRNLWSDKELADPTVILYVDTELKNPIFQYVKEVLNPWEKKNGFTPSTFHSMDLSSYKNAINPEGKPENVFILRYDPLWMQNAMTMSFFLSVFRHIGLTGNLNFGRGIASNEYMYYRELHYKIQKAIDYLIDNPRDFVKYTEKCTLTGYEINQNNHGTTGIFFLSNYLNYKYKNKSYWKTISYIYKEHPITKYLESLIEKEEELENVKMQSLQPKVAKPRTRKKVTTEQAPLWPRPAGIR